MGILRLLGALVLGSLVASGSEQQGIYSTSSCTTNSSTAIIVFSSLTSNGSFTAVTTLLANTTGTAANNKSTSDPLSFSYWPVPFTESSTISSSRFYTTSTSPTSFSSPASDSTTAAITTMPSTSRSSSSSLGTTVSESMRSTNASLSSSYAPTTSNSTNRPTAANATSASSTSTPFGATTQTSSTEGTSSQWSSSYATITGSSPTGSTSKSSVQPGTTSSWSNSTTVPHSSSEASLSSQTPQHSSSPQDNSTSQTVSNGTTSMVSSFAGGNSTVSAPLAWTTGLPSTTTALSTFTGTEAPWAGFEPSTGSPSPFVTVFPTDGISTTMTLWPASTPFPSLEATTLLSTTSTMSFWPSVPWLTTQPATAAVGPPDLVTFTGLSEASPTFLTMTTGTASPYVTIWPIGGHPTTETLWPLFESVPPSIWTLSWDDTTTTLVTSAPFPWITGSTEDSEQIFRKWKLELDGILGRLHHCVDVLDISLCHEQVDSLDHFVDGLCAFLHIDCNGNTGSRGGGGGGGDCQHPKCHCGLSDPFGCLGCGINLIKSAVCDILNDDMDGIQIEIPGLDDFSGFLPKLPRLPWPKVNFPPDISNGGGEGDDNPINEPDDDDDPTTDGPDDDEDPTNDNPNHNDNPNDPSSTASASQSTSSRSCTETITATKIAVTCSVGPASSGSNSSTTICHTGTQITRGCSVRPTASTTTTTSCSRKITVTDAAVNCSQTTTGASWTDTSLVCSTTTSLVSGCDVTASTTTITALSCPTGPVKPSGPDGTTECITPMCGSDLCGEACEWHPQQNVSSNASLTLPRDPINVFVLPTPESGTVAAFNRFMVDQYARAKQVPQPETPWPPKDPKDPGRWGTTAVFMPFEDHADVLAVGALFGCTTIVVVSRQGAWISHIWEIPTFSSTFIADFKTPASQLFTGNGKDARITALDGYTKPRGSFDPDGDENIKIWIVTPIDAESVGKSRPKLEDLRWPQEVTIIRDMMEKRFKVKPKIKSYLPLTKEGRFYDTKGELDKERVKEELRHTARGKVILQYDNKQVDCRKKRDGSEQKQQAIWRLWIDEINDRKYVDQDVWDADEDQVGDESDDERAAFVKAAEDQCPFDCPITSMALNGTESCAPPPCGADTCGICGEPPPATPPLNVTGSATWTALGNIFVLPTPGNTIASADAFYVRIIAACKDAGTLVEHDTNWALGRNTFMSSARFIDFKRSPNAIAVSGLYGCTSVVVVSREGAWMSHIWQKNSFSLPTWIPGRRARDPPRLVYKDADRDHVDRVIDSLLAGDVSRREVMPGLNDYSGPGGALRPNAPGLRIFIFTPSKFPDDSDRIQHLLAMNAIQDRLTRRYTVRPRIKLYTPLSYGAPVFNRQTGEVDNRVRDSLLANTGIGKVMLLYDPKQVRCNKDQNGQITRRQRAAWSMYYNRFITPVDEDTWYATEEQKDAVDICVPGARDFCRAETCGKCDANGNTNDLRGLPAAAESSSRDVFYANESIAHEKHLDWTKGLSSPDHAHLADIRPLRQPSTLDFYGFWAFTLNEWPLATRVVLHGPDAKTVHGSSSNHVRYGDTVQESIMLRGLWGCISIIIVSEKGCWMAHIYEYHSFAARKDLLQNVVDELYNTPPDTSPRPAHILEGFGRFVQPGEMFDGNLYRVQVFLVHPVQLDGSPMEYGRDIDAVADWLDDVFYIIERGNTVHRVPYVPYRLFPAFEKIWPAFVGRISDLVSMLPWGKVLVQYDPRQVPAPPGTTDCPDPKPQALVRVYADIQSDYGPAASTSWALGSYSSLAASQPLVTRSPQLKPWYHDPNAPSPPLRAHAAADTTASPVQNMNSAHIRPRDVFAATSDAGPVCTLQAGNISFADPPAPGFYTSFTSYMSMTTPPPQVTSMLNTTVTSVSGSLPTMTNSTVIFTETSRNSTSGPMTSPFATMPTASATNGTTSNSTQTTAHPTLPHTSCSLVTEREDPDNESSGVETTACACESDLLADMVTMIGRDQSTILGCAAGITFYTPVSTASPTISAAPLATPPTFCKLHVEQKVHRDGDANRGWDLSMELFDPSGDSLGTQGTNSASGWTQASVISGSAWGLDDDVLLFLAIDPSTGRQYELEDIAADMHGIEYGNDWSKWLVEMASGSEHILSNETTTNFILAFNPRPFCDTAGWTGNDAGSSNNARKLDFYWDCGKEPALTSTTSPDITRWTPTATSTEQFLTYSTSTDSIPSQTCTVVVDQLVWNGGGCESKLCLPPPSHQGWNITMRFVDAANTILTTQWWPWNHDWNYDFKSPGEDWGDQNGMIVNFAYNPDDNTPLSDGDIGHHRAEIEFSTDVWINWTVFFQAGKVSWFSTDTDEEQLPYCQVGRWQGEFEEPGAQIGRGIECFWDCGQGIPASASTSSTSTSVSAVTTPTASPECRLNVVQQIIDLETHPHFDKSSSSAGHIFVNMTFYDTESHPTWGVVWDNTGFDRRYHTDYTITGAKFSATAIFGFDEGKLIDATTFDLKKWADLDTLFAMTMSWDDGATWSMLEYLSCDVGAWTTYEVDLQPRRVFDCLYDCGGMVWTSVEEADGSRHLVVVDQ